MQDPLSRLQAKLKAILAARAAQPEEEEVPPPPPPRRPAFSGQLAQQMGGGNPDPFAPVRPDMPAGARPVGERFPMEIHDTTENTAGLAARRANKALSEAYASGKGGLAYALANPMMGLGLSPAAGMAAVRSLPMPQSWRDKVDAQMEPAMMMSDPGGAIARRMEEEGGSMDHPAFGVGFAAPVFVAGAIAQGGIISGLTRGIGAVTGAGAARGYSGFKAMDNVLKAQRATAIGRSLQANLPGAIASAGVTAATTSPGDESLFGLKGRSGAVAEDIAMSAAPMAWDAGKGAFGAARRIMGLGVDQQARARNAAARSGINDIRTMAFPQANQGTTLDAGGPRPGAMEPAGVIPVERRLPARTGVSGVMERPEGGRMLVTEPPAEVSPNAMPVFTDADAADRIRILKKRNESFKQMVGVDPMTGQHIDPTRQAVIDHQARVAEAQSGLAHREAEAEAARVQREVDAENARIAEEQAAADAVNPRKMSMRDLLNQSGVRYGVGAGLVGADALAGDQIRSALGQEERTDEQRGLEGTLAGAVLAGTLKNVHGVREAYNSASRLDKLVRRLPSITERMSRGGIIGPLVRGTGAARRAAVAGEYSPSHLLKQIAAMSHPEEAKERGLTQMLEQAQREGRKVTQQELETHLADNPDPYKAPLAHVTGTVDPAALGGIPTQQRDALMRERLTLIQRREVAQRELTDAIAKRTGKDPEGISLKAAIKEHPDLATRFQVDVTDATKRIKTLKTELERNVPAGGADDFLDDPTGSRWEALHERGDYTGYRDTIMLTSETEGVPNSRFNTGDMVSHPEHTGGKPWKIVGKRLDKSGNVGGTMGGGTSMLTIADPATITTNKAGTVTTINGPTKEIPRRDFAAEARRSGIPERGDRSPMHFPDQPSYGAAMRATDRRTASGEPTLAVTEWQSDNFQRTEKLKAELAKMVPGSTQYLAAERELKKLGAGTGMEQNWQMDALKTAIDDAVRMGKKYITFNSADDIYPVVTTGGYERIKFLQRRMAALEEAKRTGAFDTVFNKPERMTGLTDDSGATIDPDDLDPDDPNSYGEREEWEAHSNPALRAENELKDHAEELADLTRIKKGLDVNYGEKAQAIRRQWEAQHPGMKLNVEEVPMATHYGPKDRAMLQRKLDDLHAKADAAARDTDPYKSVDYLSEASQIAEHIRDIDSGGRKMVGFKVTDDLRSLVLNEGQARRAMGAEAAIGGGIAAGQEDEEDRDKALAGTMLAIGATSKGGRAAAKAARIAAVKAMRGIPDVHMPSFHSPSVEGIGGPAMGPIDTRRHLNFDARHQELKNDPTGTLAMQQRTAELVQARGSDYWKRVTQEDVKQAAVRLGLDPEELLAAAKKRNLSPAEQLAASDVVAQNMDNIVEYQKRLDDPATPPAEKESIKRALTGLESQTNELLWANLTERTAAGRNLAFQKIASTRTMDPSFWMGQAAKNMGNSGVLSMEHMTAINQFIAKKDRAGLASYVASLKPGEGGRIAATAYKAGLLTNPSTHVTNIASNVAMAGLETAKDVPGAGADRVMTSLLNAALGGDMVKRSRDASLGSIRATMKGAGEGLGAVGATMRGQDTPLASQLGKYDMPEEIRTQHPILNAYLNGPFRALRASDNVFREAAFLRSLEQQRRLAGIKTPAKNITEAVKSSTPDMVARAVADAEIATFQNSSMLGRVGSGVKNAMAEGGGTAGRLAGEFLLPFTKTPGAVASSVVRYSPLALARAGGNMIDLTLQATKARAKAASIARMRGVEAPATVRFNEQQLAEQVRVLQELKNVTVDRIGRGATGTAIMALGAVMASNGMLTVKPGRTDRAGRETGEVTGDPGNTIDFGPLNGQIDRLSPLGNLLLLGAYGVKGYEEKSSGGAIAELEAKSKRSSAEEQRLQALKQRKEEEGTRLTEGPWGGAIAASLGAIGNTIIEQPVFSGVKRVEDVLADPVKATQRAFNSQIASFIPAGVGAAARVIDPERRQTETLGETLRARIPFASSGGQAKLDALGTPIAEPLSVRLANLISPMRLSTDRTSGTGIDAKVRRILDQYDIPLSAVTTRTKEGESQDQARTRQQIVGKEIRDRVASILPGLEQIAPNQRADYVALQINRARTNANARAKAAQRIPMKSSDIPDARP